MLHPNTRHPKAYTGESKKRECNVRQLFLERKPRNDKAEPGTLQKLGSKEVGREQHGRDWWPWLAGLEWYQVSTGKYLKLEDARIIAAPSRDKKMQAKAKAKAKANAKVQTLYKDRLMLDS
jgi:hypothetical protein